jgi:hypothetical protein
MLLRKFTRPAREEYCRTIVEGKKRDYYEKQISTRM